LIFNPFFFLDEKETKNQDLGFSAIKIGSLPKTQKLPRSQTRWLKQFEFLYGPETSGSPFCPDASGRLPNPMVVAEFLSTTIDPSIPLLLRLFVPKFRDSGRLSTEKIASSFLLAMTFLV
jgi:hypothetical protein